MIVRYGYWVRDAITKKFGTTLYGERKIWPDLKRVMGHTIQFILSAIIISVILGTAISEFQVTVLGVLRNAGPAGDLVLFRASGPAIQATGGLASGMSGSPVYLGGKLAGADVGRAVTSPPIPFGRVIRSGPGGWHYSLHDGRWLCDKRNVELYESLSELIGVKLGEPVAL